MTVLEAIPDAVIAVDSHGVIQYANQAAQDLTGYSVSEIVGQQVDILLPASGPELHVGQQQAFYALPPVREMGSRKVLGLRRRDGVIVPVEINLSPLPDSYENIVITTIRDVSDRERRSKEETLLSEIISVVDQEHKIDGVYEALAGLLPTIFQFDRFTVGIRVPGTRDIQRVFVSGEEIPDQGVGATESYTDQFVPSVGPIAQQELTGDYKQLVAYQTRSAEIGLPSWLHVSLGDTTNPSGHLSLRSKNPNAYYVEDLILLQRIADRVNPAITNARLFEQVRNVAAERATLASVSRIVASTQNLNEVFDQFAEAIRNLVPAHRIYVRLLNDDETSVRDAFGWDSQISRLPLTEYTPVSGHPMEILVQGGASINVHESNSSDFAERYPAVKGLLDSGFRSMASTALRYKGQVKGGLVIAAKDADAYGNREIRLLEEISAQVAGTILNSELVTKLGREAELKRALAEIGKVVSTSFAASDVFDKFAPIARQLFPHDSLFFADYDQLREVSKIRFWHGREPSIAQRDVAVSAGSVTKMAVAAGRAVLRESKVNQSTLNTVAHTPQRPDANFEELICVPLTSLNMVYGCLYFGSLHENVFKADHLEIANQLADQVSGALINALSHEAALEAEKRRAESEARSRELKRIDEGRSLFLSTVSHELKTPLTSLTAFTYLLKKNQTSNLTERQIGQIDAVQRSARRLEVLINDLLDVSHLEAGELTLIMTTFELGDLASEIASHLKPMYLTKSQSLNVEFRGQEVWVVADRVRIGQVLTNLLTNSSKYSNPETEITLRIVLKGEAVSISVEDHGIGMSSETQSKLFTPFFRSDDEITQSVPGSGLGLSIVKRIIELHDGSVAVTSEPGVGTKVNVLVPINTDNSKAGAG